MPPQGLSSAEAARILAEHGPNEIPAARPKSFARRFLSQLASPLIYILLAALAFEVGRWAFEGAHGTPLEAIAIGATLVLNALFGAAQEHRSERALARLRALAAPRAWVVRDGVPKQVPAREIVPGDLLRVEAGDRIPADGALASARSVLLDESVLTGESLPVEAGDGTEVESGTLVARGTGLVEVTRTGAASAMGRLARMLGEIEAEETPLEKRLRKLGNQLARWMLALVAVIVVAGFALEGASRLPEIVLFAVALAVAAVPEELPAVLTLTLALGVERMAKRKALVRRLSSVEALGSVTVIATDKTGTLTENRLEVRAVDAPDEARALRAMVLASDADPASGAGDPIDLALLAHAARAGLDPAAARAASPRVGARPFDSEWKFARATVEEAGATRSWLKGAPEAIVSRASIPESERARWLSRASARAAEGYRVLALATAPGEAEEDLELLGLVLLWDPPRPEVKDAMRRAQEAGVRVLMVTGDHPETALAVARAVGMPAKRAMTGAELAKLDDAARAEAARSVDVFARVRPEDKLAIVDALKRAGEIVAMTGDGVNDAPALKRADVGVAMGVRGSDVAREVASLVLLDDNFATIVAAIEEGRGLYANIQKFIRFMFSTSLAFLLLVLLGTAGSALLGARDAEGAILLPLTALQILWINFLADGPPAFALGLDANRGTMSEPPRPPESPLLDRPSLRFILGGGAAKALLGLAILALVPALGYAALVAQTAVFAYEFLAQLAFAYPSRVAKASAPNRALAASVAVGAAMVVAFLAIPPARDLLGLVALDARIVSLVLGAVLLTWLAAVALARWARAAPLARSRVRA